MKGVFYVVPTPIGHLGDMPPRGLEILKMVDYVLAENPHQTSKLLNHYNIDVLVKKYNQYAFRDIKKVQQIAADLFSGYKIALVTDAGTPGISDPGNELINFLHEMMIKSDSKGQIRIVPIPGPSSLSSAMSVSGFRMEHNLFVGFWPKKGHTEFINKVILSGFSFTFFESSPRLAQTLKDIKEKLGETKRRVFVIKEISKFFEQSFRGSFDEVIHEIENDDMKGEAVVIVEGDWF